LAIADLVNSLLSFLLCALNVKNHKNVGFKKFERNPCPHEREKLHIRRGHGVYSDSVTSFTLISNIWCLPPNKEIVSMETKPVQEVPS
jgi:hypothetical protein